MVGAVTAEAACNDRSRQQMCVVDQGAWSGDWFLLRCSRWLLLPTQAPSRQRETVGCSIECVLEPTKQPAPALQGHDEVW